MWFTKLILLYFLGLFTTTCLAGCSDYTTCSDCTSSSSSCAWVISRRTLNGERRHLGESCQDARRNLGESSQLEEEARRALAQTITYSGDCPADGCSSYDTCKYCAQNGCSWFYQTRRTLAGETDSTYPYCGDYAGRRNLATAHVENYADCPAAPTQAPTAEPEPLMERWWAVTWLIILIAAVVWLGVSFLLYGQEVNDLEDHYAETKQKTLELIHLNSHVDHGHGHGGHGDGTDHGGHGHGDHEGTHETGHGHHGSHGHHGHETHGHETHGSHDHHGGHGPKRGPHVSAQHDHHRGGHDGGHGHGPTHHGPSYASAHHGGHGNHDSHHGHHGNHGHHGHNSGHGNHHGHHDGHQGGHHGGHHDSHHNGQHHGGHSTHGHAPHHAPAAHHGGHGSHPAPHHGHHGHYQ